MSYARPMPFLAALVLLLACFAPRAADALEITEVTSPGGIRAYLAEDSSLPLMSLAFAFRGGAALDPDDRSGLAYLTAALLDQGAGDYDGQAFQRRLADHSISLGFDAGRDSFGGRLSTLTEHRDEAFRMLRLALTEPRFDEDEVRRMKESVRVAHLRRADQPGVVAQQALYRALFGGHAYARDPMGDPEHLDRIDAAAMSEFVRTRLARRELIVAAAGDIDAETFGRLLDETFGGLAEQAGVPLPVEFDAWPEGGLALVRRNQPQSVAYFASRGIARDEPDWFAALAVNYVLGGGGFASRLMEEVREKRGLAYAVGTSLAPLDRASLIVGRVATENRAVADSVRIVREEWRRMAEEGPTEEELADAKAYLTGSFPLGLDGTGRIAGVLLAMLHHDLPPAYLGERAGLIEAVTPEDARRVARRLLVADDLLFVVVGDPPEGLEPTLTLPDSG
jgi:zinc protease